MPEIESFTMFLDAISHFDPTKHLKITPAVTLDK